MAAYLDPGTGSILISAILGLLGTALFFFKTLQYKLKVFVSGLFGVKVASPERYGIVFYSEGKQYWSTFEPVLEALDAEGVACSYLTSREDDPGLSFRSQHVRTKYIGSGYRAYMLLNVMQADVCVTTTPGLDVLQIKRSKGVKHYVHLVHSIADIGTYKRYSFDYFDTVLTSNSYQIAALRELEKLRGTPEKALLETGCIYMDRLEARVASEGATPAPAAEPCVLVAATWGGNGLLSRYGTKLLKPLLDAGLEVIIRPHPQSYISEKPMLEALSDELVGYTGLSWDDAPDAFGSMRRASVLVSDLSGIVFDFAFVFGKPIAVVRFEYDETGMEASDLRGPLWEVDAVGKIGLSVDEAEIASLPQRVRELAGSQELRESIQAVKEQGLFHPGEAARTAARQILEIHKAVASDAAQNEG